MRASGYPDIIIRVQARNLNETDSIQQYLQAVPWNWFKKRVRLYQVGSY